jgi:hypothetical protein
LLVIADGCGGKGSERLLLHLLSRNHAKEERMKKLTLTLDHLEVETFVAGPDGFSLGTVRAHDTEPQPIPGEDEEAVAPAKSWDTMCDRTICFTCDRMCPSNVTACYTGSAPACCV